MRCGLTLLLFGLFWSLSATCAPAGGPFGPREMLGVANFPEESSPVLSPSGDWVAYTVVDTEDEANILARHPTSFLWVVSAAGGSPTRVLKENEHAESPAWSPDGRELAFIRIEGRRSQAMVWDLKTKSSRAIGPIFSQDQSLWGSEGIRPLWTPNGKTLLVAALEEALPKGEAPRVTTLRSTDEVVPGDVFFMDRRLWRIIAIDVESGRGRTITSEPAALRKFVLSPDGVHLAFRAITKESLGHFRAEKAEWWVVNLENPGMLQPAASKKNAPWVVFSPDGQELYFPNAGKLYGREVTTGAERVASETFPEFSREPSVSASGWLAALVARPGSGPIDPHMYSVLRPTEDVFVMNLKSSQSRTLTSAQHNDEVEDPVWSDDGRTLFYRSKDPATFKESIFRWTASDASSTVLFSSSEVLEHLSSSANGGRISYTAMSATHPRDANVLNVTDGRRRAVTHLNPQLDAFHFVEPQLIDFYSADGKPLRGLLYEPVDAGPQHRVSTVTYVYEN